MSYTPAQVAKSIVALATTATGTLLAATAEDGVSGVELLIALLAALGSAAAVFATPNAAVPGTGRRRAE